MTTENPKVSGYVSQEISDRLKIFKEERQLKSTSEALGVALAEYFQVDQKVDRQSSLSFDNKFVTLERFEELEQKYSELPSELERMFSSLRNELLNSLPKAIKVETVNIKSELLSELQDEPLSELLSELVDEPLDKTEEDITHLQLDITDADVDEVQTDDRLVSVSLEFVCSLSGILLAKRLGTNAKKLSTNKKEMLEVQFYDWLKNNDPDKILWQPIGGDLKKRISGWIPAEDTPSELLGRLKEWLVANPDK